MAYEDFNNGQRKEGTTDGKNPGPFLARVTNNLDGDYMGTIRVQILHQGASGDLTPGEYVTAKYLSAYWGNTASKFNGNTNEYADTQKSWGMWIPTPEINTQVVVIYLEGNSGNAYWIGATPDRYKNFMTPGIAATSLNAQSSSDRLPVAEVNANYNQDTNPLASLLIKAIHPLVKIFKKQGLIKDDVRGITSSSSRRETPSHVFGISTPGPIDYAGVKKPIGTQDAQVMAFVDKLGGSTFVMDDGDDTFFRKTPASEGPPEYVAGYAAGGKPDIPHNELVRIRTRTGHQILLHNSEDLIYIGNAKGTTWIELTSNGKIDIFAEDSISIHTNNDLNIRADRDLNLEAGRNVNIKAVDILHAETSTGNLELLSGADTLITSKKISHINSAVKHVETAAKIYMNDPGNIALTAIKLSTYMNPTEEAGTTVESILLRVPSHEPWPCHENLNPADFVKTKTDIKTGSAPVPPGKWQMYTTPTDTFKQGN